MSFVYVVNFAPNTKIQGQRFVFSATTLMKNFSTFFLLTICMLVACRRKEKPVEPYVAATAGTYKFFSSGQLVKTEKGTYGAHPSYYIEAVTPSGGATIKLWIRNYSGALDTLDLDSTDAAASFIPETPSIEKLAAYGKLIVTETTPTFRATFDFICTDTTRVYGDFKVAP